MNKGAKGVIVKELMLKVMMHVSVGRVSRLRRIMPHIQNSSGAKHST